VFDSGQQLEEWLNGSENPANAAKIRQAAAEFRFSTSVRQWLKDRPRGAHVIAIAEDWCGDVVRHVPVLAALEAAAPDLHVRFIRRDQHPDVFARFLTNGGEAIPKFVFLSDNWVECGNWGPMPQACSRIIARGKACGDVATARQAVAGMYADDAECDQVLRELITLIDTATCTEP